MSMDRRSDSAIADHAMFIDGRWMPPGSGRMFESRKASDLESGSGKTTPARAVRPKLNRPATSSCIAAVDLRQVGVATISAVRIDSRTELVIAVDVAKRLGISSQRVNVLASGPGFPKALGRLGRWAVWRWSAVERWARETGRLPAD